ncbi:toxin, partial [Pseudomonas sp. FSL R10-0071]|uniref:S-type pyocin domain-containing protein n=1 Tax=Pseudomonas sp. FSL R10-0071 TaxID=2662193 RepID=UPI00135FA617
AATAGGTMIASLLAGLVAFFWPSDLADSALYTEDQLRSLKQARTRMRLYVEQQADGALKGYGFYTGTKREWEMIDVIQF